MTNEEKLKLRNLVTENVAKIYENSNKICETKNQIERMKFAMEISNSAFFLHRVITEILNPNN